MTPQDNEREKRRRYSKKWIACPVEQDYIGSRKKEYRQERKRAMAADRSKFKKTDQKKEKGLIIPPGLSIGRVIAIISQGIIVDCGGKQIRCQLRGVLKKERTRMKNLIVVGDIVHFQKATKDEGLIHAIDPRKSTLSRADNLSRNLEQLIAANIDQVFITASVVNPMLRPPLIDRYIIAASKGNMRPIVLINKTDLLETHEAEAALYEELVKAYAKTDTLVLPVSVKAGAGLEQVKELMQGKASAFAGQSGVGKSSLINAVTGLELRTRETVSRTKKGAHTTTQAQLIPLEFGGFCIDTPGIRSFGLYDLERDEIEQYFTEIHNVGLGCKFSDCSHTHEADCRVIEAVEAGEVSSLRYDSYCQLLAECDEQYRRR